MKNDHFWCYINAWVAFMMLGIVAFAEHQNGLACLAVLYAIWQSVIFLIVGRQGKLAIGIHG